MKKYIKETGYYKNLKFVIYSYYNTAYNTMLYGFTIFKKKTQLKDVRMIATKNIAKLYAKQYIKKYMKSH